MRKMSINRGEKIFCDLHRVIEDRAELSARWGHPGLTEKRERSQ